MPPKQQQQKGKQSSAPKKKKEGGGLPVARQRRRNGPRESFREIEDPGLIGTFRSAGAAPERFDQAGGEASCTDHLHKKH